MRHLILSVSAIALAVACTPVEQNKTSNEVLVDSDGIIDYHFSDSFKQHLKTISSDEFEGRAPASKGEELTIDYLAGHMQDLGIQSLTNDRYTQAVPLVRINPTTVTNMQVQYKDKTAELNYSTEMTAWTNRVVDQVTLENSELVFVGYGIVAPEFNWDDYQGLDVAGKTVVMFVNDPGYATQDESLFGGNAMTYYGRWTYKYEEAARQGAAGAIIIHENGPAGYGWNVVAGGSPERFTMKTDNNNMDRVKVEGWFSAETANQLFENIGLTLEQAHDLALADNFEPISLEANANLKIENEFEFIDTHNVVGYIEGSTYPEEHIIYMAHWDHLGVDPETGEIFNGAQDNANGTASILSIAEKFANGPQPERSIVFAFVGAEERGLLGSAWYVENPLLPLEKAVAGINIDMMFAHGPTRDFVVVGWNNSDIQDYLAPYVEAQNRYLSPENNPEAGIFYRSDHFSMAKKGVPVLYGNGGIDHFLLGAEYGQKEAADFIANRYHAVGDKYNPDWDLRGNHQDTWLFYRLGNELANSRAWPKWTPGNEFEALRLESEDQRK